MKEGLRLRGDILDSVLLFGGPGTGKSQRLKWVEKVRRFHGHLMRSGNTEGSTGCSFEEYCRTATPNAKMPLCPAILFSPSLLSFFLPCLSIQGEMVLIGPMLLVIG